MFPVWTPQQKDVLHKSAGGLSLFRFVLLVHPILTSSIVFTYTDKYLFVSSLAFAFFKT